VIVGDQACVRERVEIGADVVIGRGSLVENDTTVGALTKIQAHAYITPTRRSRTTSSSPRV
jgi:UDP-3-O-[3-hydroxymyristoyl] glucosamine N-acyltransferase